MRKGCGLMATLDTVDVFLFHKSKHTFEKLPVKVLDVLLQMPCSESV